MAKFVSVIISGNSKPLKKALDSATGNMTDFQKKVAVGFLAAGAAATAFATSAIKAAAKDQVAMQQLERQIRASTHATTAQVAQSEKYLKSAGRASAFGKSALIPGYQSLILATHNAGKAQELLNVAMDTARARNLDVTQVSNALSMAYAGNMRGLRALSPEMKKMIKDGASLDDVIKVLTQNFGGAAAGYAKTFQGRLDILGNSTSALKKQIGYALLPVVEKIIPVFQGVVDILGKNPKVMGVVAFTVGALATAFVAASVGLAAYKIAAIATTVVNEALGTSFSTLQVTSGGIIAVVAAAAAVFVAFSGSTDQATASTEAFNSALFTQSAAQLGAIRDLATSNPAFAKFVKFANAAGYSVTDLQQFLIDGKGPMKDFGIELSILAQMGLDKASSATGNLSAKTLAAAKAAKITDKEFQAMSSTLMGLWGQSSEYRDALKSLTDAGLNDTSAAQDKANKALENAKTKLADAKKAVRDYANSIKDALVGMVSLSSAFTEAQTAQEDASKGLNDALNARADAYAKLNALEQDRYANAKDLAAAQQAVADAENNVNKARTVTAPNYTELFKKQIEDAKKFAGLLKQLRASNLSDAAVSQLLALGPIAGAQVAQDLISGANGMSISGLSKDIATVGSMGYQAGIAGPGEAGILNNTKVGGSGGNYSIYVTSADPKAVVAALKEYMRQNGAVPIKVTGK